MFRFIPSLPEIWSRLASAILSQREKEHEPLFDRAPSANLSLEFPFIIPSALNFFWFFRLHVWVRPCDAYLFCLAYFAEHTSSRSAPVAASYKFIPSPWLSSISANVTPFSSSTHLLIYILSNLLYGVFFTQRILSFSIINICVEI